MKTAPLHSRFGVDVEQGDLSQVAVGNGFDPIRLTFDGCLSRFETGRSTWFTPGRASASAGCARSDA